MSDSIKQRLMIFAASLLVAIVFIYPTINLVLKKVTGSEVTAADMQKKGIFSKPLALGLDLSGGVHLVYQVVTEEALKSRLISEMQTIRAELRKEKVPVTKINVTDDNIIEMGLLSDRTLDKAKELIMQGRPYLNYLDKVEADSRPTLRYEISQSFAAQIKDSSVAQAIETLRNRVDQFGVSEPLIQQVGTDRILLQMPGVKDIESVKKVVGKVAKLEFRIVDQGASNSAETITLKNKQDGAPIKVSQEVLLTGSAIDDARVDFNQNTQVEVSLTLNSEGGKRFAQITGENVGKSLAIILDNEVYSYPRINERISGGRCSISGGFTLDEAKQLAVVLKAGALPAPLKVLEERTVGPTLGAESIRKGINAIAIGMALICVFMIFYYKKSGLVAILSLALNLFLMCALLSAVGATLTLPGLAGLALTIGMAVDANVVIFERIRDEIRNGSGRDAAVAAGFEKALSAILDSNITTLLSALILVVLGSGSIRGFGFTLAIGIITTIYCATFVSRLAFDFFDLRSGKKLSI
jgi:preprotein translocase subunit SecD